jgi:hypothetical protein
LYPRFSREELEGRFLGRLADLDPKGEGDNLHRGQPAKQKTLTNGDDYTIVATYGSASSAVHHASS